MRQLLITSVLVLMAGCSQSKPLAGRIAFMRGQVIIERNGISQTVRPGDMVWEGDAIRTGNGSALLDLNQNGSRIEIQHDTVFVLSSVTAGTTNLNLNKGAVWTSVAKLTTGSEFRLRTPATVAGVRGTKFYTYVSGGRVIVCHCEGKVALENKTAGYNKVNDGDYMMVFHGQNSAIITTADLAAAGLPSEHNHGELPDNGIGKSYTMTSHQMAAFDKLVAERMLHRE